MVDKADDPIAMWQQMVGEMQKGFRAFGHRPANDAAGEAGADTAQKRLADLLEGYFAGMNLPSRAQLNAMGDRLQAIEGELADIKALLHEALINSRPADEAPRPPIPRAKRASNAKSQRGSNGRRSSDRSEPENA